MLRPAHPFLLVRHGETDWNREGRFQGQTDIPINALGKKQATANGRLISSLRFEWSNWRFVSSPLARTRETMQRIRTELRLDPDTFAVDPALIEVTFGDWERCTLTEITKMEPDLIAKRAANKWDFVPPSGESYAMGAVRAERFLRQIAQPSLIVTHGGIIRAMRYLLEGLDKNEAAEGHTPQDKVYYFDGNAGGWID